MEMHTLLLCRDAQYLGTISRVVKPLGVTHTVLEDCAARHVPHRRAKVRNDRGRLVGD